MGPLSLFLLREKPFRGLGDGTLAEGWLNRSVAFWTAAGREINASL